MSKSKYTALIADDDAFIRQILVKTLSEVCTCIEIPNGKDVAESYKQNRPDIVFLDIHIADVNGLDLIKEIKTINWNAYIIVITSDSTQDNVRRAIKEGASDFIAKPFDTKTILEKFNCAPTVGG